MEWMKVLEDLCGAQAPSGFEGPAVQRAAELLRPLADEVKVTRLQSVAAVRRCGLPGAKTLLLDAHLDEIGFLVTGAEEGFLRFRTLGGVDQRMLPGREVTVLSDPPLTGIMTLPPLDREEDKAAELDDLVIDVGLSQEEAERLIPAGTPAVYRESCFPLGEGQVCGKALDDRGCFAILLRTLELLRDRELKVDVWVVGSSCEEVGGRGALTAAWEIRPDYAVAVDVTHGATPDEPLSGGRVLKVGGGPAIGVGPVMTRWMSDRMQALAKEGDIPFQLEVMADGTGTNGDEIQTVREGVATAVLSLPLKYMHTPVETASLEDMEQTARLLAAFAASLGEEEPCGI